MRVLTHDCYCCSLLDLSLLQLMCTGGYLGKRVVCVVERGVRWYIELLPRPCISAEDHEYIMNELRER